MSIQGEINRINENVSAAYDQVEAKGGTLPTLQNTANLLSAIASIKGIDTIAPSSAVGSINQQI